MVLQRRLSKKSSKGVLGPVTDLAQSGESIELTAYAKRLPKPPLSGSPKKDQSLLVKHQIFQRLISALQNDYDQILPAWGTVTSEVAHEDPAISWDDTTVRCQRLPKYWMAQHLVQHDPSPPEEKVSQALLDKMDAKDPEVVRKVWHLHTMTLKSTKVPVSCRHSKALCSEVFADRMKSVVGHDGKPTLCSWSHKYVNTTTLQVDWLRGGPYKLIWQEGKDYAQSISAITGEEVKLEVDIDREFTIKDPWDPFRATAIKGMQKYRLCEAFLD